VQAERVPRYKYFLLSYITPEKEKIIFNIRFATTRKNILKTN